VFCVHSFVTWLSAAVLLPTWAVAQAGYRHRHGSDEREALGVKASIGAPFEQVLDLPLGDGKHQRILYAVPDQPRATIVMLPGGDGDLGMMRDGSLRHGDNFVVRTRAQWVGLGYAVLIPDAPRLVNLRGLRSSPQYARLVEFLVRFAEGQIRRPVFLLGTSRGSIAAMNGAAHATTGALAGVVLTESVSRPGRSRETVFNGDPGAVRVAALVVADGDDKCDVAPPEDAPKIAAALSHARAVQVLTVAGGSYKSQKPCGSLTPHGYYGIEASVIGAIDHWMRLQR
jgi:hypothetical protein